MSSKMETTEGGKKAIFREGYRPAASTTPATPPKGGSGVPQKPSSKSGAAVAPLRGDKAG